MRWTLLIAAVAVACGHGGSSSSDFIGKCANPRSGTDPLTGQRYIDQKGSLTDEKNFLRAWTDELYLWYREVPTNLNQADYATALDWFNVLKTPLTTASGAPKDKFHFTYDTATWEALSSAGVEAGYGVTWDVVAPRPPREVIAAYTDPSTPAAAQNIARGAQVLTVDGTDVTTGDPNALNAGLFPANTGESHTFVIQDAGATSTRTVTMVSAAVTSTPVQNVGTVATGVGYMLFNAHIATAEKELIAAVNQLAGVSDLVIDLRYNGGGYLDIASEMAFMIAGPARTAGKTFEKTMWNDKHPTVDPVTGNTITPLGFHSQTLGFTSDVTPGQPLPHLDLPRVFLLTGSGTCSASESIINSLRGVDVQVILIGSTTCGKPYGFYPQDNCGTTYFSIQFQGVNEKGFGDYSDGFVPAGSGTAGVPGCQVADDLAHPLGNPAEARLAAALGYRQNQTCPPPSSAMFRAERGDGELVRPPWRENRLYRRSR